MATYGPNSGTVPFTGFTPTLGTGTGQAAATFATAGAVGRNGLSNQDYNIAQLFSLRGSLKTKELLLTLLGVAPGALAQDDIPRVFRPVRNSDLQEYGGLATVQVASIVNRVTTAADTTAITAMLAREPYPSTYVRDLSGNGGGGKAGY